MRAARDRTFGGNTKLKDGAATGSIAYQDHGDPGRTIRPRPSTACAAAGTRARVYATTDDGTTVRVDFTDANEPGVSDTFRIRTGDGYDSRLQTLTDGNVQVRN